MKKIRHCTVFILVVFMTFAVNIYPIYATVTTYDSTDVPKTVTEADPSVISSIEVPCGGTVVDVNVQLDISHTYDDDLEILLIAPGGRTITLSSDNGGSGHDYSGTIFDDEADTAITDGTPPFSGSYQPEESLSIFDGLGVGGNWGLLVRDDYPEEDDGTINSWSLTLETAFDNYTASDWQLGQTISTNDPPVTSTITVCEALTIHDINVQVDIAHDWDTDLDIFLIAPNGTRVELSTDNGGGGSDYSDTVFDDEADTSITDGIAPFVGSYRPESPLSVLDGATTNGTWTLEVGDDYPPNDDGWLRSWRLLFTAVVPGFTVSTYADDLPSHPAGLTADQRTRTLYYADSAECNGILRKITPEGTVSTIIDDFTPNGAASCTGYFYPFNQTDIQYLNGSVYVPLSQNIDGELVKIDTTTGSTTTLHTFDGFGLEGGIVDWKGKLLVTSGNGLATEIQSYNPATGTADIVLDVSPLLDVLNVEYNPGHDAAYFWSLGGFYRADLAAGTYTAIPSYIAPNVDFAVSPDGNSLFTVDHPDIDLVSVADGSSQTLFNGLTSLSRHDMVLASSSSGNGCSLYVVDGKSILELSGIEGNCKPFPWLMFLPAITHK